MTKKPKRARSARRERARAQVKDIRAREKLNHASLGGSASLAIEVTTPAVIATRVRSMRCHQCDGELEPPEVAARSTESGSRRVAVTRCRRCHTRREIWFALGPTMN